MAYQRDFLDEETGWAYTSREESAAELKAQSARVEMMVNFILSIIFVLGFDD